MSLSWQRVGALLDALVVREAARPDGARHLDDGQRDSLSWLARRLPAGGLVLADEVGTGKTRIACAVVQAVLQAGGRAAVVVPQGLVHQWQREAGALGLVPGRTFSSVADVVRAAETTPWEELRPRPEQAEWLLVSQGFGAPRLRAAARPTEWRVALTAYVHAALTAGAEREDRRTRAGKLLDTPHAAAVHLAGDIVKTLHGGARTRMRARLEALPPYRRGGDNDALVKALQSASGRALVEELLGLWLGPFDLLVIDEAHKGRAAVHDDPDEAAQRPPSGSTLSRLVTTLLRESTDARRICLTATPMELDPAQWLELLGPGRARTALDLEHGRRVLGRLHCATTAAATAPDERARLDALCAAARDFTRALSAHVTRRRREDDPLIARFREAARLPPDRPHVHRRRVRVVVPWTDAHGRRSPWLDVLFAAECMGHSARGLTRAETSDWPRSVRDAYRQLASGHVSADFDEQAEPIPVPAPGVLAEARRAKVARTAHWQRRLRESYDRALGATTNSKLSRDADHPRVRAAVSEIEHWTLQREKVLVFGVYLRPLRLLRQVLDVRHALRAADVGQALAYSVHTDPALFDLAAHEHAHMREQGALSARLAAADRSELRRALGESHAAYGRLRKLVRERAKKTVASWRTGPRLLDVLVDDRTLQRALEDHLVSFVLDDLLGGSGTSAELPCTRFRSLADEFFAERLRPLLGEPDDDAPGDERERHAADLRSFLEQNDGRQSHHARVLAGDTAWSTRQFLQAAFNRPGAAPAVLIAQSQVGREGLNLHEACRVVVQFHAEWNPATLEQQVGRVDRKGSLWERRVAAWLAGGAQGEPPSSRSASSCSKVPTMLISGTVCSAASTPSTPACSARSCPSTLGHVCRRSGGPSCEKQRRRSSQRGAVSPVFESRDQQEANRRGSIRRRLPQSRIQPRPRTPTRCAERCAAFR